MTKLRKHFLGKLIELTRSSVRLMFVRRKLAWIRFKISWAFFIRRLSGHRRIYQHINHINKQLDEMGKIVKESVEKERRLRIHHDKVLEKEIEKQRKSINVITALDNNEIIRRLSFLEHKYKETEQIINKSRMYEDRLLPLLTEVQNAVARVKVK